MEEGIISPGGVGYDINCGVRLLRTDFTEKDIASKRKELLNMLIKEIPAGVGKPGITKLSKEVLLEILKKGSKWALENGYGSKGDLDKTEEYGCMNAADPGVVSERALARGLPQLGTLGSGNHFLELQKVDKIYDAEIAKRFGIDKEGQVTVMIHCLPGTAKVLTEHGSWISIKDLETKWENIKVKCLNSTNLRIENTKIKKFFKLKPHGKIFKIITKTKKEIIATDDHPFLTQDGLKTINEIETGNRVAILPFSGIEYEYPLDHIIVDENRLKNIGASERTIKNLKKRGLLPLNYNSFDWRRLVRQK